MDNERIEIDLSILGSGGIYFIEVINLDSTSNTYDLWWDDERPPPPPGSDDNYEENDTLYTAYDFSSNEMTNLSVIDGLGIAWPGDDDWYQIEITPGYEYLTIDCLFSHAGGDIDIFLYTADGTFVADSEGVVDNERIEIDLSSLGSGGIYFIEVINLDSTSNTYDLWSDDTKADVVGSWSRDYDWSLMGMTVVRS